MTTFELWQLIMNAAPVVVTIIGGLLVFYGGYRALVAEVKALVVSVTNFMATIKELKSTVASLAKEVDKLSREVHDVQSERIDELTLNQTKTYADVRIIKKDVVLIKADIEVMRRAQEDDARGAPQKGELPDLPSTKAEEEPDRTDGTLEERVETLEDTDLDDLRVTKKEGDEE